MSKLSRALFTAVMGAALVAPIQVPSAEAAISAASVSSTLSLGSGTVRIYGSATQTFTNPSIGNPLSLSVSGKIGYFYIQNNGEISTPAFKMTITLSAGSITTLKRCDVDVLFTTTAGVCASGTATTIAITAGTLTTITLLMAPTTFYNLELTNSNKNVTATVDLSVNTSQLGTRTVNS